MADTHEESSLDTIFEISLDKSEPTSRTDAIVVALHACLISDRFHLVAIGDEGFESGRYSKDSVSLSSASSPSLPSGWNKTRDVYSLQYKQALNGERVCLVKALPIGEQIIVNVLCSDRPKDVLTVYLSLDEFTKEEHQEGDKVSMATFKNMLKLFTTINKEINAKIKTTDKGFVKSKDKPTRDAHTDVDPLRVGGPRRPHPQYIQQSPYGRHGYGAGDLSPFGGPGGMMFDPLRQGGGMMGPPMGPHPPGFVPPGARYDPVSPFRPNLNPNRQGGMGGYGGGGGMGGAMYGPDPDHLPPPGSDDMFS